MIAAARYVHTNLVARDFRALARFYQDVFGCVRVPPERDYPASELEAGTGVSGASLRGVHLRLPGGGREGPTLEIFQYAPTRADGLHAVNATGYGHIAFAVADVHAAREEVLASGGTPVGEVVVLTPAPDRTVVWCYVRDPEGNVIELQSWNAPERPVA